MRHRVLNYLHNKELFWKSGKLFENKISFPLHKNLYGVKYKFREEKISAQILRHSLKKIVRASLVAAVFVTAVEFLSYLAKDVTFKLGSEELGLFISTVVTVSGVFLGLYFTALSAVAGNLFMRAPSRLQNLFLRDRKGSQYVQTLALTLIVGIYYLLLRAFGYEVGFLGPIFIVLLAVYAIVRFMALGAQTFYFIHPGEASSTLTGDAVAAINGATFKGSGKRKSYLQNHYRKQAKEAIDTLNSLIDFGVDPVKLSGQQMLEIAHYAGSLLDYYLEKKKHIPTQSYWFSKKYEHQKWLITDESAVTMALNTGTSLSPKEVRNGLWFEEEAIDVVLKIFKHLAGQKDWGHAQACLEVAVSIVEDCGSNFDREVVALVIDKVQKTVDKVLATNIDPQNEEDRKGRLAILDSLGRLPIGALVSLTRYMDKRTKDSLKNEIHAIKWVKEKTVYFNKMPGMLLAELERTQRQYANEIEIEKHPISPEWYIRTITTQQYLAHLKKYYDLVKSYNDSFYKMRVEELIKQQEHLQAAHLTNRWLEFTNKLLSLGWKVQHFVEECGEFKQVHDLPWTTIDNEEEKKSVQGYNQQATDKLAQLVVPLSTLPKEEIEDLPDYFGQAFIFGLHAAYDAAKNNDAERLRSTFPGILIGALMAKEKVREDVEGWLEQSQILLVTESLEDLLTLSGFIKIYAELYENPDLWKVCEDTWDRYLGAISDAKSIIQMLVAGMRYRDTQFIIMHRATLRINWDQKLRQVLEERGFRVDLFDRDPFDNSPRPQHPSPIIRVITRNASGLTFDARNVFLITYMSKHPAAQDVEMEFPDRRDFERHLEQEENRGQDGQEQQTE